MIGVCRLLHGRLSIAASSGGLRTNRLTFTSIGGRNLSGRKRGSRMRQNLASQNCWWGDCGWMFVIGGRVLGPPRTERLKGGWKAND